MDQLDKDRRKIADFINDFVEKNGYDIVLKNKELLELFEKNDVSPQSTWYLNSDICYDSTNDGMMEHFEKSVHLFSRPKRGYYRILGENYPYTGFVKHKPRGSDEVYIVGEWLNGELIKWEPKDREMVGQFEKIAKRQFVDIEEKIESLDIKGSDKVVLAKERVNQTVFRERLLKRYKHCCLCGISKPEFLFASHIKPWSESNPDERVDVNNGLLLCPHHDRAFDRGYISFDDKGQILISKDLNDNEAKLLNIYENMSIKATEENSIYMKYHRNNIYKG